jgi:hypothetical protein
MTLTWNSTRTWWNRARQMLLVALVLCVSACTTLGHSNSAPSAHSPEGGHEGPKLSGDGDGGSGM